MGQVIFTGDFNLDQALADFGRFAQAIENRLRKLNEDARKVGESARGKKTPEQIAKEEAKAQDELLKKKIQVAEKENLVRSKLRAAEQVQRERDAKAEEKRQQKIADQQLAYNIAHAKKLATEQEKIARDNARKLEKLFAGFTVGGFALQRFGQFLQQGISQPLQNIITQLYETTVAVDDFAETLKVRGDRTKDEIEEIYQVVKRVSDLPNLQREDILTIFSRLEEVTQGGLTARELEKIGQGLSKITTSLESGEKRAFYGQLQDILGGGNVANLEKTLSLVPLLKSKYDELKAAATVDNTDSSPRTLILQALTDLSVLPNVDNLATSVKRLTNELFEIRRRIGEIYKDELKALIDFVVTRVFPTIEHLLEMFEKAGTAVHTFVAALAGLAIIIPPLISIIGAFAIALGGVGFAIAEFNFAFGSFGAVFGSGGTIASFLTGLTSTILPNLLKMVSGLGAVITLVVIGLTKAFSSNAGGIRNALDALVSSILPAIGNFLLNIFRTLTSIMDILSSIYDIIDLLGAVTTTFGILGSTLAYILTTAIQLTNILSLIPAGLAFLNDILSGNVDLAFARINLAFIKFLQSVTVLAELFEVLFGADLTKAIANAEAEVEKLDLASKGMHKTAQSEAELTKQRNEALNKSYKESQQTILEITEAIKAQTRAIEEQTFKQRENAAARFSSLRQQQAELGSNLLGEQEFDLSSTAGIAAGRQNLSQRAMIDRAEAARQARERTQKALRDLLKERRDEFIKMAEKEISQDAKQVYEQYAELIRQTIEDPTVQITPDFLEQTIFKSLSKTAGRGGLQGDSLKLLTRQLANEKLLIQRVYKLQLENIDEASKADAVISERERQFNKKVDEQNRKDAVTRLSSPLLLENERLDRTIARQREGLSKLIEIGKTSFDILRATEQITKAEEDLLDLTSQRAVNLGKLDALETKSAAEHQAAQDKIEQDTDNRKDDIRTAARQGKDAIVTAITKEQYEMYSQLEELQRLLLDKMSNTIRLENEIIAAGGTITKSVVDQFNETSEEVFRLATAPAIGGLAKAVTAFSKIESAKIPQSILDIFKGFKEISTSGIIDPAKRKAMIEQAQDIVKTLQFFLTNDTRFTPEEGAQLQVVIDAYIKLIETIKNNEGLLTGKIDQRQRDLEIDEIRLSKQQEINDTIRDQLELEKEILEIRRRRGIDLESESGILAQIWDVITGSRKAIIEAEKKIIENQRKAANLELEIALSRLEIEQLILETKMRELGLSEDEIARSRELYNQQVEALKRKAILQQEILDEQEKSLKDYSGGILDIIFQAISDGMNKAKEKKNEDYTGIIDDAGNVTDEDGGVFGAGDPEEELDAIGDSADEMAQKMEKARKMTLGLGQALLQLEDLSLKSIAKMLAAELKTLQKKATIKALEYAAIALSAAVFGDWGRAAKATAAAAAWTGVAIAAGAASKWLAGKADEGSAANSQSSKAQAAGNTESEREKQLLKQKALSILIQLDIRTDDGIIIQKNVKALNQNTELTNLTLNSADGWLIAPAP